MNFKTIEKLKNAILSLPASLAIILSLAAFTHFFNLFWNPLWYDDEGWSVSLIKSIIATPFKPSVSGFYYVWTAHAPLSYYLAIPFFLSISNSAEALRSYVAVIALVTAVLVYFLGKELDGKFLGLISGIVYATMTPAIVYYRLADPDYALGALFVVLAFIFLTRYLKQPKEEMKRWLGTWNERMFLISLALGFLSLYYIVIVYPAIFLGFLIYSRKRLLSIYLDMIASVIPTVFLFLGLYLYWGTGFSSQLFFSLARMFTYGSSNYLTKFGDLMASYWPFIIGLLGMIYLVNYAKKPYRTMFLIMLFVFLIVPALTVITVTGSYATTYVFPAFAIGIAYSFVLVWRFSIRKVRSIVYLQFGRNLDIFRTIISLFAMIILVISLMFFFFNVGTTLNQTINGFAEPYPSYLFQNQTQMNALTTWLNAHTNSSDLVIGSSYYLYLLNCKTCDFTYVLAYTGQDFYMPPISQLGNSVIKYTANYTQAKYAIIDPFVTGWFIYSIGTNFVYTIMNNWTIVYQVYNYTVYQNPSYP
jgi:uncharacterized membrane protein